MRPAPAQDHPEAPQLCSQPDRRPSGAVGPVELALLARAGLDRHRHPEALEPWAPGRRAADGPRSGTSRRSPRPVASEQSTSPTARGCAASSPPTRWRHCSSITSSSTGVERFAGGPPALTTSRSSPGDSRLSRDLGDVPRRFIASTSMNSSCVIMQRSLQPSMLGRSTGWRGLDPDRWIPARRSTASLRPRISVSIKREVRWVSDRGHAGAVELGLTQAGPLATPPRRSGDVQLGSRGPPGPPRRRVELGVRFHHR